MTHGLWFACDHSKFEFTDDENFWLFTGECIDDKTYVQRKTDIAHILHVNMGSLINTCVKLELKNVSELGIWYGSIGLQ